ncbi:MAG: DUF3102 domain-containing protein [bacterium]
MVPKRTLADRAPIINHYHDSSEAAYGQACRFAVLCGMELLAAKEQAPHGEWLPWVEKNCKFDLRTSQRYMLLADRAIPVIEAKYPVFGDMDNSVAPSMMMRKERDLLLSAVRDMTDHRTIQELQLELGIIKPKVDGTSGGANNPYGRAGNPATVMDRAEAERLMANKDWSDVCRITVTNCQKKSYGHLEKVRLREVWETLRSVADELEDFLKKSK